MLSTEQQRQRESKSELMRALGGLGAKFKGTSCTCPFHDDAHPSASIYQKDGAWKFHCHVCEINGDIFDVQARGEGRTSGDVLKETKREIPVEAPPKTYATLDEMVATLPNVTDVFRYTNPENQKVELAVIRQETETGKTFKQGAPYGDAFAMKAPKGLLPIYNRGRVASASEVVVVEGEKCVHALHSVGIVATTSPGGAGKAANADWSALAGKKVYLWPDNDAPDAKNGNVKGEAHMRDVAKILSELEPAVQLFWLDVKALNLPVKGDVVDYLQMNGGTREDGFTAVRLVLDEAEPLGGANVLRERYEQMGRGEYRAIEWPWPEVSRQSMCLMPATITSYCGDPGAGKSFKILQAFMSWFLQGVKVALYELEDDLAYHLTRAHAQLEGESGFTNPAFVEGHLTEVQESFARHSDILNGFARRITVAPATKQPTLKALGDWVEQKAEQGCRIIGIDPITGAEANDKPWIEDQKFIFRMKPILSRTGASLILVTHPRTTPGKKPNTQMSNMAGGAAYPRFSQSVLWLHRHDAEESRDVFGPNGTFRMTYERSLQIRKARNGSGAGREIAFHMEPSTLRFSELGVILPEGSRATSLVEDVEW